MILEVISPSTLLFQDCRLFLNKSPIPVVVVVTPVTESVVEVVPRNSFCTPAGSSNILALNALESKVIFPVINEALVTPLSISSPMSESRFNPLVVPIGVFIQSFS
ncbi:hypothetical protein D3C81_757400 [compost metagenome]